jgi:hypothetical protein
VSRTIRDGMCAVVAIVLLAAGARSHAAEIVLERSAVERLVQQALFNDKGRYFLQRGACYAYLEDPVISLGGGRLVLNANLSSFLGMLVNNQCVGVPLKSKVTVSGRPAQQPGGVVRLVELSIDNIADASTRGFVQSVVLPRIPQALEIDVGAAVRSMLKQPNIPYTSELERIDITAVSADNDRLGVTFDFKLLAR